MPQNHIIIPGVSLGQFAKGLLHRQGNADPAGISSRGLYLRSPDDTILFLSSEKFRGPLTVNMNIKHASMLEIKPTSPIFLSPTKITFPGEGIQINLENAVVWNASLPFGRLPAEISRSRLESTIEGALRLTERNDCQGLLTSVLPGNTIQIPDLPGFDHHLTEFLSSLEQSKPTMGGKELSVFLGLGPGLTPLGDDFILGVILTLNRWEQVLIPVQGLEQLNRDLLKDAGNKTTALSASLLSCAIEGTADERLLAVLDSLFSGDELSSRDLEDL
ncbi:MAG: DUF2877 domain-containing protein, partial [Anaerolineales bacterium]|nr:DUF2877 domain-containing protein [Anaerolineales bacterium]